MATTVKPIPDGTPSIIANLVVRDAASAIRFYVRALGAEEVMRMPSPDGKSVWHAELRVGNARLYVNDEMPGMGAPAPSASAPAPVTFWVPSADCDAAHARALAAGGKSSRAPADMFWGDRVAGFVDPFGYRWEFATHVKDMTPDEMRRAGEAFARQMAAGGGR